LFFFAGQQNLPAGATRRYNHMQHYKDGLTRKFEDAWQKLNARQRMAVNSLEGPVMVIAGPGTGKTQILATRIGRILLETDAQPDNILCLTYTDAGTVAMRKRLQQFIGADAYRVNIYTFHAFCNDIIQENLSLFEKNSLDPISDLEKIQLYKTLIDRFPKHHPLKRYRGDVYFEVNNLQQLFSTMKREGWTPDFIEEKINAYLADLPARDTFIAKRASGTFKKGDLRTDKIAEETEKMEKLRAAVREFDNLQALMREKNRYDFDDMINWVIRAFNDHPPLLLHYQERFQYVLVDEYQDTSGTQNTLVRQLISFWEKPNVFVVGDDDQSIYRFQGANVENMLDFALRYADSLITVVLTDNYRSTQPILDTAKILIDKNEERLVQQIEGLSKELLAANPLHTGKHLPQLRIYATAQHEMADLANRITALVASGTEPGRIAVIYKENRYGEALADYLRLRDLPVYSKRNINILLNPFVSKIILLLRYLNAEHDIPYGGDEMLFELMHLDFYKIPPMESARLTVAANSKSTDGEKMSLRRLLYEKANTPPKDLFDKGLHEGLKWLSQQLEALIADVSNLPLQQLVARCITHGGVLRYIMQHNDKAGLMQLVTAFFDFVKEETARNPALELAGLINIIDLMEKENLPIPMVQVAGSEKGINLLTAHGSKGLEYEYVFIAGCNAGNWEKKRKPGGGYKFPDTLFSSQPATNEIEELRRLFYVALTRAEEQLVLSYARFSPGGKEIEPSMFIAEIQQTQPLPTEEVQLSEEDWFDFRVLQLSEKAPEIAAADDDFISGVLDKFVMNVTALNNYLNCPLEFYYKNLIRIPTGKSEATEFGSSIHFALQRLFEKMLAQPDKQFPAKSDTLADFKWYMNRHRENFTREGFARRMEYGDMILSDYYDTYIHQFSTVVTVERNISKVVVEGVPLRGKLDKLEFDGNAVNVVDYKTGDIDNALPKLRGPGEHDPNGGSYWRQAVFYKILVDNYPAKDWRVVSTEFDFIEPDKKKTYRRQKLTITPQDVTTVTQQIKMVWDKIQARDFYTGCGRADCHWCNFVKNNQLAIALHDIETEE
jgi:DNA helicase II / ATP-dependent DNA helicase PcrA